MINVLLGIVIILLLVVISYLSESLKAQKNVVTVLDPKYKEKQLIEQEKHLIELQEQVIELGERKELLIAELTSLGNAFEKIQNSLASTINVHSNEKAEMKEESMQTKTNKPIIAEKTIERATTTPIKKEHLKKDIEMKEIDPSLTEVVMEDDSIGADYEKAAFLAAQERSKGNPTMDKEVMEVNEAFNHFFGDEDVPNHIDYA